jgi:hypothetical protein
MRGGVESMLGFRAGIGIGQPGLNACWRRTAV